MGTTIKVSNREIAIRAFEHLRQERKTDSALRLAHHLLHYDLISLGIGEVDWEIDMAIQKFGGNPRTGYRYTAHFSFKGETDRTQVTTNERSKENTHYGVHRKHNGREVYPRMGGLSGKF